MSLGGDAAADDVDRPMRGTDVITRPTRQTSWRRAVPRRTR